MSDMDLMAQKYPSIVKDGTIKCGICDPNSIQNRLTTLRYDTALFVATLSGAAPNVLSFAAVDRDFFVTGKGEALGGLATATKDLSYTNLDAGGSAAESPCIFTGYSVMVEFLPLVILDATGNESLLPSYYYDQAYNRAILNQIANRIAARLVEPNGCTDDLGTVAQWPADGSARGVGDQNRSAMLGVTRGLRAAVCFPGQNAKRPKFTLSLVKTVSVTENGANPFGTIPGGSILAVPVRLTVEGAVETPP